MTQKKIRGAGGGGGKGGGGGGGHVPTEQPDSLHSRAYARVIDAIAEGEIEGLINGLQSIYLDDTPIQNPDGSNNFAGVSAVWRNGTPDQAYIPGFAAVENEVSVATEVKAATPVARSIQNTNLTAIRVTVTLPQLTYQDPSTGDLGGSSVEFAIDLQNNGGGWQELKRDVITGKTISRYQRSYRIDLPAPGPWDVRVRRITPDSTKANLRNQTWWASYTEIIDSKLRYPNTALVAIQIDAKQFQSIPRRGYHIRGLRVQVPSNYDPLTRTYTGVWDGAFKIAWTDNPVWCFYDLLTHERYGLGHYIDATMVDKWALYEIAQYCDQPVPDGFGGTEPRFTCNLYLQTREEAHTVLSHMASIFRGMIWWSQGTLSAVQDAPADPAALFTAANVIDGAFTYSGSSGRQRHTVALVSWNDPSDHYRRHIEYVEDPDGIARYGVRETEIVAIGCTSRGQAHRAGRWLLYTERLATDTITFRTGLQGVAVWPGAIIQVADPFRAGKRLGGRVVSATADQVTLDDPVTLSTGNSYELSVQLPDGSVETRAVTTGIGTHDTLQLAAPYSAAPQPQAVWILAASDLAPTLWRVVSMAEVEPTIVEITALAHDPGKYDAIEQGIQLEQPPVTDFCRKDPPTGLAAATSAGGLLVSWDAVPDAERYEIVYQHEQDNPVTADTPFPSYTISPAPSGLYTLSVRALRPWCRATDWATLAYTTNRIIYEPDPAMLDQAALGATQTLPAPPPPDANGEIIVRCVGMSLLDVLTALGATAAIIRFARWTDRPADAQGRSVFIFEHPVVVPDSVHTDIQDGAILQFNQGASTQGALILGTGGLTVPMGAAAVPVFDDRSAFNNAVWWPAATLNLASPTWWGATGDGSDASRPVAAALYVLSEGGTLEFSGGHFLIQGNNPATNAIIDIPSNVVIRGAGMDITFIDINTAPNVAAFQAKKTDGVQVLDLTFQGVPGTPADARALKFTSSTNVVVDRVKCVDIPDGIRFSDTQFTVGTVVFIDNSATNSADSLKGMKLYGPSTGAIADFQATGRFTNNCLEIEQGRDASAWAANTAYTVGNLVIPTSNPTFIWRCVTAGTSGATEPNWSLADASGLVTDGTVVWEQDAAYGRPHDITINRYTVANLVEPLRLREVDNLTLLTGTATDAGYETGTTAGNGNVLFDVRRATNVTINGLTVRNAVAAPDLAKVYETDGFLLDNADVCGVDRGVRLKQLAGYGPSNNVRLTSNVRMNCGKAKTDPTYVSPDSKRCQVLDGSTNVSDNSDFNTGCP